MAGGEWAWMGLSYFGLTVASAVFPWVSAEVIILVGLPPFYLMTLLAAP